jgi:hypothetical protein
MTILFGNKHPRLPNRTVIPTGAKRSEETCG